MRLSTRLFRAPVRSDVLHGAGDGVDTCHVLDWLDLTGYSVEMFGHIVQARDTESWQGGKSRQTRPYRGEATLFNLHTFFAVTAPTAPRGRSLEQNE